MSKTIEELYQLNEELFRVNTEIYQAYEEAKNQVNDQHESIEEKNDEIDGLKADLERAMVYLEGHHGREQKLKKIIRDITSDYLDILSDKDMVIEELYQLVKDLS